MDCFKVGKVFYGHSCWKSRMACPLGLKRRETFQHVISVQFKSQHPWWHEGAYDMGSLHVLEGTMNAERYIKVPFQYFTRTATCLHLYSTRIGYDSNRVRFRATYAHLQTTSISGKALCISAGQCKTTNCSFDTCSRYQILNEPILWMKLYNFSF